MNTVYAKNVPLEKVRALVEARLPEHTHRVEEAAEYPGWEIAVDLVEVIDKTVVAHLMSSELGCEIAFEDDLEAQALTTA